MKEELIGLTREQVKKLQNQYGKNELSKGKKESFIFKIFHIITEPMFLLLITAAIIYFILGEPRDGLIMLIFVIGIISIDVIQEWKTDKTLQALKDLSAPKITVIRDSVKQEINSSDIVPGDIMFIYEGVKIPADGVVVKCSGLRVDESSLTGEAEVVFKTVTTKDMASNSYFKKDCCYAGTLVTGGTAIIRVSKIGDNTEYGKIGSNVINIKTEKTPLEKQTDSLVRMCAWIAFALFVIVAVITYINIPDHSIKDRIIESILSGITLAMAMIPEEFPVVLTVFLSMGAWRLATKNSLVKKLSAVETLGTVSVLCVDKTGTITMNEMTVADVWSNDNNDLALTMGLCCQEETYDPMEKAMLKYCSTLGISEDYLFAGAKIGEYSFSDETKMMGCTRIHDDTLLVAAKGSPESILKITDLTQSEREKVLMKIDEMSKKGQRVIAVGKQILESNTEMPASILNCKLKLCGLVGLIDPPRKTIRHDIKNCNRAGIRVVMITGDNGLTASTIAKSIGMPNSDKVITGDMLDKLSDNELKELVKNVNIFSRVIPAHKMRIVKAFKDNGEVVAMTGDGVNDAPALKYSDIGIAMGKRGSEVSREAADLILMDDNFSTIVDTVKDGRRIYDNIKKAVGYILTIHVPIALASLCAPLLGISPSKLLLLPFHIVLLELIIDPTSSIVLERQPAEEDIMSRLPRKTSQKLVTIKDLTKSLIQGLIIFMASFFTYYIVMTSNYGTSELARTMGLAIIMLSNLCLVLVNSSDVDSVFMSLKKLVNDKVMWLINIVMLLGIGLIVYSPLNIYLKLVPLSLGQVLYVVAITFISVFWYEIVKYIKRLHK